jgi:dephospho-CoA kinase
VLKITQIPYKIGITGTIGSGKSLVGDVLQEAGVPVLDTDDVVDQLYREDEPLKQTLAQEFGPQVINAQGRVDNNALREIVFNNIAKLKRLESIVHPRVAQKVKAFFEDTKLASPLRAVLVPLLFEAKTESQYDEIWAVTIKPEVLIQRLIDREDISREEALSRIAKQWSQEQKAQKAHRVIDNSGTKEETKTRVLAILKEIQEALPQ